MKNSKIVRGAVCALIAATLTRGALAITVSPGETVAINSGPATGGTMLAVSAIPFGVMLPGGLPHASPDGTYTTHAFLETNGNLTFSAEIQNGPFGALNVGEFTMNGFAGVTTDVTFINAGSPVFPVTVARSADGDALQISFGTVTTIPNLPSGEFTDTLLVHTNAQTFTTRTADIQVFNLDNQGNLVREIVFPYPDPSKPGALPSLAPGLPEPETPLLMTLAALLWWARRAASRHGMT